MRRLGARRGKAFGDRPRGRLLAREHQHLRSVDAHPSVRMVKQCHDLARALARPREGRQPRRCDGRPARGLPREREDGLPLLGGERSLSGFGEIGLHAKRLERDVAHLLPHAHALEEICNNEPVALRLVEHRPVEVARQVRDEERRDPAEPLDDARVLEGHPRERAREGVGRLVRAVDRLEAGAVVAGHGLGLSLRDVARICWVALDKCPRRVVGGAVGERVRRVARPVRVPEERRELRKRPLVAHAAEAPDAGLGRELHAHAARAPGEQALERGGDPAPRVGPSEDPQRAQTPLRAELVGRSAGRRLRRALVDSQAVERGRVRRVPRAARGDANVARGRRLERRHETHRRLLRPPDGLERLPVERD